MRFKLFITVVLMLGFTLFVEAQSIRIGANVSYYGPFGETWGFSFPGGGIRGGYVTEEGMYLYGGFEYYAPQSQEETAYILAHSNSTTPGQDEISVTREYGLNQIFFGGRYYVADDPGDKNLNFYLLGEVAYVFGNATVTETEDYNEDDYYMQNEDYEEGSEVGYSALMVNIGGGLEVSAGPGYLFAEPKFAVPASGVSSRSGTSSDVPLSLNVDVGYSFEFGGGSGRR